MSKKGIINRRFCVCWVKEATYNRYEHVDPKKWRPIMVWVNKSDKLVSDILGFYCSTKVDPMDPDNCILIEKAKNPAFKFDTYVWISKPMSIRKWHIRKIEAKDHNGNLILVPDKRNPHHKIPKKLTVWTPIIDEQTKRDIGDKIKDLYKPMFE